MESVLTQEVARASRGGEPMGLLFCDLDGFKAVNDKHGHQVGDTVLRLFALVVTETLRAGDTAARYGGDEFVSVLPGADREVATSVSERLRQAFSEAIHNQPGLNHVITAVSVGVAVYPEDGEHSKDLLAAADTALLADKARLPEPVVQAAHELRVVQARQGAGVPAETEVVSAG